MASLISPLGGFFASGYKRSKNIKDFSNLIPGHGGITDRMDSQIIMGLFVYLWTYSIVIYDDNSKVNILLKLFDTLSLEKQILLKQYLQNIIN